MTREEAKFWWYAGGGDDGFKFNDLYAAYIAVHPAEPETPSQSVDSSGLVTQGATVSPSKPSEDSPVPEDPAKENAAPEEDESSVYMVCGMRLRRHEVLDVYRCPACPPSVSWYTSKDAASAEYRCNNSL